MKYQEYAVYKGDELLAIGTAKEISEELKIKENTLWKYLTPAYKKLVNKRKNPEKATIAVKI